ncbi:hypothetical protein HZA33_01000 [Candidatus Pacearchaeota archaeon]|nr:hypothetical protein [Candidatus Pacearchaeota archaeon]
MTEKLYSIEQIKQALVQMHISGIETIVLEGLEKVDHLESIGKKARKFRQDYTALEKSGGLNNYTGKFVVFIYNQERKIEIADSGSDWLELAGSARKKYGEEFFLHRVGEPFPSESDKLEIMA